MNRPPQHPAAVQPTAEHGRRGRPFTPTAWLALIGASLVALAAAYSFAQDATLPKGIGPYQEVELAVDIDADLAARGEATYDSLCAACHKFGERYVGPDLEGVTQRRSPEWILNLLLNTDEMLFNDDTAYELLAEYMTPMPQLLFEEDQAFAVLEYFRLHDAQLAY